MGYKHDMSGEKEKKELIPEGWRKFEIYGCEEYTSKAGKPTFKLQILDSELGQDEEIYATAVKGKRWFLKQILAACGVAAAQDGVYEWDIPDILDKVIMGKVVHYPDTWINRSNQTITTTKWKIAEVRAPETPEEAEKSKEPF